ncbi:hypothetical protein BH10PSE14_BH10PSE14_06330 [soil metagenome]
MSAAPAVAAARPPRQPATVKISPSNIYPWYGSARPEDRFTGEQLRTLARMGLSEASVEVLRCKRAATDKEMWWPTGELPPVYEFDCPVLHPIRGDKVRVIAPSGAEATIGADGWVGSPPKPKRARGGF